MKRKKILFITYYFPPSFEIGAVRTKGITKYLKNFGWDVTVITTNDVGETDKNFNVVKTPYDSGFYTFFRDKFKKYKANPQLINSEKKSSGIIFSILNAGKNFVLKTGLFCPYPDDLISWKKYAVKKAIELHEKENFDAVLISSTPVSVNLIASEIKKHCNIPWVADFRDLWTQNHYYPHNSIRKFFEQKLELKTLKHADALVTVSDPLTEDFKKLHKNIPVYTITNGYDPDEFASEDIHLDSNFSIIYTGRFYPGKLDPETFFIALKELVNENKINKNKIKVNFYGFFGKYLESLINKYKLQGIVEEKGFLDREIILEKQKKSQLLLILNWNDPKQKGIITGKIFEYLAAQRPVLAIGANEDTELAKMLEKTGAGESACSVEKIKKLLLNYYDEYLSLGKISYKGDYDKIKRYSHLEMAKKFADVLNKVT